MNFYVNTGSTVSPVWKRLGKGIEKIVLNRKGVYWTDVLLGKVLALSEKQYEELSFRVTGTRVGCPAAEKLLSLGENSGETAKCLFLWFDGAVTEGTAVTAKKATVCVNTDSRTEDADGEEFILTLRLSAEPVSCTFTPGGGVGDGV